MAKIKFTGPKGRFLIKRHCLLLVLLFLPALLCGLFPCAEISAAGTPSSYKIENVPLYGEEHNLSCEYASAHMITAYWGKSISESQFTANIGYNSNPHLGFRGDPDGLFGGFSDYGVYAEPIARYLEIKGFNTKLLAGDDTVLRQEIALGRPQLVWLTYQLHNSGPQLITINGLPVTMVPWEHAAVVTGYDEGGVFINGPADGSRTYFDWPSFKRAWGYFGNMALSIWPKDRPSSPDESFGVSPLFYRTFINEGQATYGRPLTAEIQENGRKVQYFELARLEYDPNGPENQPTKIGFLGSEISAARKATPSFQPVLAPDETQGRYYKETRHILSNRFLKYWSNNGDLILFGLPISEEFTEKDKIVQYFERARLEFNPADGKIRPGPVGSEALTLKAVLALTRPLLLLKDSQFLARRD